MATWVIIPPMEIRRIEDPGAELRSFVDWVNEYCEGKEKSEAHLFLNKFFQAFGYGGIKEAGANLEESIRGKDSIHFADLVWKPRVLIEMKSRGVALEKHYDQAFEYWIELVPDRPEYVILCNFDEFWIYNFNLQLDEPLEKIVLSDLPNRINALGFFYPSKKPTLFGNNLVDVTKKAAGQVARVYSLLSDRGVASKVAQRFVLQCIVSMFAEDIGWWIYPDAGFFTRDKVLERVEFLFNRTYKRAFGSKTSRIIRFAHSRDSKLEDLIQLADLLVGVSACDTLGPMPTSQPKLSLVEHWRTQCKMISRTRKDLERFSQSQWTPPEEFAYRQK